MNVHVYISNIPQVRATVEERIGIKFEVFKVLIYRVTPSGRINDGCYHMKVFQRSASLTKNCIVAATTCGSINLQFIIIMIL